MVPRRQNPSIPTHRAPNITKKRMQETILPSTSPLRSSQLAQKRPASRSLPTTEGNSVGQGEESELSAGFQWARYVTTVGSSWCYRFRKPDAIASWWSCQRSSLVFYLFKFICLLVNTVRMLDINTFENKHQKSRRYRDSGDRYVPPTKQRLREVNCTFVIGVRFVGKVANRSILQFPRQKGQKKNDG